MPLTLGISDLFESRGLRIFGPNKAAAQLEGSKAFAKEILHENKIPTAAFGTFTDAAPAKAYLARQKPPYVIKADGLAAGKGVLICANRQEADAAIEEILVRKAFGSAGEKLVIEEFLDGEEASFMVLTDGEHVLPLASSQDHKRVFDNDEGPNTGGMGAYSPAPAVTPAIHDRILRDILTPLLAGLKKARHPLSRRDLRRPDDHQRRPESVGVQCALRRPRMPADHDAAEERSIPLLEATIDGKLDQVQAEWHDDTGSLRGLVRRRLSWRLTIKEKKFTGWKS